MKIIFLPLVFVLFFVSTIFGDTYEESYKLQNFFKRIDIRDESHEFRVTDIPSDLEVHWYVDGVFIEVDEWAVFNFTASVSHNFSGYSNGEQLFVEAKFYEENIFGTPINLIHTYQWSVHVLKCESPGKPQNPSPSNGATVYPEFDELDWGSVSGADRYEVYFGTDSSPDSGEYLGSTTSSHHTINQSLQEGTYYWKVVAVADCGEKTESDVFSFTAEAQCDKPEKPQNPSPSNGATVSPEFDELDWGNVSGANKYEVYFGTDSSPDSGEYLNSTTSSRYTINQSLQEGTYYWKIVAVADCGAKTESDVFSFTAEAQCKVPEKPQNPSPSNGTIVSSVWKDLKWNSVSGANTYEVYFGMDATPDSGEYLDSTTSSSFTINQPLLGGVTYYWKVIAVADCGEKTGSDVFSFRTEAICLPPSEIQNPYPSDESIVSVDLDELSWSAAVNADQYKVYFGTNSTPGIDEYIGLSNSTQISLSEELIRGEVYYWKVQAENDCEKSSVSEVFSFQIEEEKGLWDQPEMEKDGWRYFEWIGWIYSDDWADGWMYHAQHEWIYTISNGDSSMWLFDNTLGWVWTAPQYPHYLYALSKDVWLFYVKDSYKPRWFYSYEGNDWVTDDNYDILLYAFTGAPLGLDKGYFTVIDYGAEYFYYRDKSLIDYLASEIPGVDFSKKDSVFEYISYEKGLTYTFSAWVHQNYQGHVSVRNPGNTNAAFNEIRLDYESNPKSKIILIGFSAGGGDVVDLAVKLNKVEIPVVATFQIDSVEIGFGDSLIPGNILYAFNYYQDKPLSNFGIEKNIKAYDSDTTTVINFEVDPPNVPVDPFGFYPYHRNMDNSPIVMELIFDEFEKMFQ